MRAATAQPLAFAAALVLGLAPALAPAQTRPTEDDLFGAPPPTATPTLTPTPTPTSDDARAADLLGARDRAGPSGEISKETNDPLALGGLLYLRGTTTWNRGVDPADWAFPTPNLMDVYLDARPNDRVRGFALGRFTYDPSLSTAGTDLVGNAVTRSQTRAVLDQLYVNFDLGRTVFVTAGRQHVKWGTGRIWNPGDFLHPVRRDPLARFDDRTGVTMVKAHLPWEARGWNFYGVALLEDVTGSTAAKAGDAQLLSGGTRTLGDVGVGARVEAVLGPGELSADFVAQRGHRPRFGVDGSVPVGDFDLHGELALRQGKDAPRWYLPPGADRPTQLDSWVKGEWTRLTPAVVLGVDWSAKYSDEDSVLVSAEWYYDDAGYGSAQVYFPLLVSPLVSGDPRAAFTPFYLGRQYAGLSVLLQAPGSWNDTTFNLSAIANLSDGSGLLRLDHSVVLNTYLTLETYAAGHLGHQGGEFRFGGTIPPQVGYTTAPILFPTAVVDLGVALRVKL